LFLPSRPFPPSKTGFLPERSTQKILSSFFLITCRPIHALAHHIYSVTYSGSLPSKIQGTNLFQSPVFPRCIRNSFAVSQFFRFLIATPCSSGALQLLSSSPPPSSLVLGSEKMLSLDAEGVFFSFFLVPLRVAPPPPPPLSKCFFGGELVLQHLGHLPFFTPHFSLPAESFYYASFGPLPFFNPNGEPFFSLVSPTPGGSQHYWFLRFRKLPSVFEFSISYAVDRCSPDLLPELDCGSPPPNSS